MKVIDLGKYSPGVKLRKMRDSLLYFAKEMFTDEVADWKPTPLQLKLIDKLSKSKEKK